MAKFTINPDRETTIEDELKEDLALGILQGYIREAMAAKAAHDQEEIKEGRKES